MEPSDLEELLADGAFVELTEADGIAIDLRYAGQNNFLGRSLYGCFIRLILHVNAAEKLRAAVAHLERSRADLRLSVLDGLRPNRIQRQMWATVVGTPEQIYVADPHIGSIHGFGLAVDVTLIDEARRELDMGTPFDTFEPLAEPQREAEHLASGALTAAQVANRELLRNTMLTAGFHPIALEWWHFDALLPEQVRSLHRLVE